MQASYCRGTEAVGSREPHEGQAELSFTVSRIGMHCRYEGELIKAGCNQTSQRREMPHPIGWPRGSEVDLSYGGGSGGIHPSPPVLPGRKPTQAFPVRWQVGWPQSHARGFHPSPLGAQKQPFSCLYSSSFAQGSSGCESSFSSQIPVFIS